jgi:hypothetical protein
VASLQLLLLQTVLSGQCLTADADPSVFDRHILAYVTNLAYGVPAPVGVPLLLQYDSRAAHKHLPMFREFEATNEAFDF